MLVLCSIRSIHSAELHHGGTELFHVEEPLRGQHKIRMRGGALRMPRNGFLNKHSACMYCACPVAVDTVLNVQSRKHERCDCCSIDAACRLPNYAFFVFALFFSFYLPCGRYRYVRQVS